MYAVYSAWHTSVECLELAKAVHLNGGVQVAESQLFAGCPCWWKDGTEKKEVVDSQGDIPHH